MPDGPLLDANSGTRPSGMARGGLPLGPLAVFQVDKVAGESGPVVHVHQQLRDLDARQHPAGKVDQCLSRFGHHRILRADS